MHPVSLENNMFIYHTDQPANVVRKTVTRCCENPKINKNSVREKCGDLNVN
jgi:hypothetical protein